MEYRDIDIKDLLPQRPPMLQVDAMVDYAEGYALTEFLVREDCIFVEDGVMKAEGIIENVAQTCAARIGYYDRFVLKVPVKIGYIGAIKGFQVYSSPAVGTLLKTSSTVQSEFFGISLVRAEVRDAATGELVAAGTMKIAIKMADWQEQ